MKSAAYAITNNRGFSYKGGLPWGKPLASDMSHFVSFTTEAHYVVMGFGTFRSLPGKLKGRYNVVLCRIGEIPVTKNGEEPDVIVLWDSKEGFLEADRKLFDIGIEKYCVIGGRRLIEDAINSGIISDVMQTTVSGVFQSEEVLANFDTNIMMLPSSRGAFMYDDCVVQHFIVLSIQKESIT